MGKNVPVYAIVDITTAVLWPVKAWPNALHIKQKLLPLTNLNSTMGHQMESSKLGLTNIPNCLVTKSIQLILNFPNISEN